MVYVRDQSQLITGRTFKNIDARPHPRPLQGLGSGLESSSEGPDDKLELQPLVLGSQNTLDCLTKRIIINWLGQPQR